MKNLSKRQLEVLIKIEKDKLQGYNPSMSSLSRDFRVAFTTMRNIVLELERKGFIRVVQPTRKGNRRTGEKHILVLNPIISKKENMIVIGNLSEEDLVGVKIGE